jgi:hypothetical protein
VVRDVPLYATTQPAAAATQPQAGGARGDSEHGSGRNGGRRRHRPPPRRARHPDRHSPLLQRRQPQRRPQLRRRIDSFRWAHPRSPSGQRHSRVHHDVVVWVFDPRIDPGWRDTAPLRKANRWPSRPPHSRSASCRAESPACSPAPTRPARLSAHPTHRATSRAANQAPISSTARLNPRQQRMMLEFAPAVAKRTARCWGARLTHSGT